MTRSESNITKLQPLRQPTFFILLSLASGDKHGYAILQDVTAISRGEVRLGTSTLYEALARLLDQGLIERIDESRPNGRGREASRNHPGRPRKSYRLTQRGRRVLEAETHRLRTLVTTAQRRLGEEQA
jgi:DNA-binding PadR family transcriptional regulator